MIASTSIELSIDAFVLDRSDERVPGVLFGADLVRGGEASSSDESSGTAFTPGIALDRFVGEAPAPAFGATGALFCVPNAAPGAPAFGATGSDCFCPPAGAPALGAAGDPAFGAAGEPAFGAAGDAAAPGSPVDLRGAAGLFAAALGLPSVGIGTLRIGFPSGPTSTMTMVPSDFFIFFSVLPGAGCTAPDAPPGDASGGRTPCPASVFLPTRILVFFWRRYSLSSTASVPTIITPSCTVTFLSSTARMKSFSSSGCEPLCRML